MVSSKLITLLGSYHPNMLGPDQVDYEIWNYFDGLNKDDQLALLEEMKFLIDEKKINAAFLSEKTGETFDTNKNAVAFFSHLYQFLSGKETEPDISNYIE